MKQPEVAVRQISLAEECSEQRYKMLLLTQELESMFCEHPEAYSWRTKYQFISESSGNKLLIDLIRELRREVLPSYVL